MIDDLLGILTWIGIGCITATVVRMFVEPLLPSNMRERMIYMKKFVRKYLSMSDINLKLVSKAIKNPRSVKTLELSDEFREKTIEALRSQNFHPSVNEDLSVRCVIPVGNQSITIIVDFVSEVSEDNGETLYFESIEIRILNTCKLNNLSDGISELYSALNELRIVVQKLDLELKKEFCIVCEINTMPNIKIMLDTLNYDTIHCKTPDGQNFELQENKILYYDKTIHRDISSFIKKIIITYS